MHDVIVAGGSLNGLAVALALGGDRARSPLDVLVVDAGSLERPVAEAADRRASAISAASRNLFTALGIWDELAAHAQPMQRIEVIDDRLGDAARPSLLNFGGDETASAHIIENQFLYRALRTALRRSPAITVRDEAPIDAVRVEPGSVSLTLADGSSVRGRLLVGADGRRSLVRQSAGIETVGWEYGQVGIVFSIDHEHSHHGIAEEHFLPPGPFATLPLPGHRSSIVWTETTASGAAIMSLPPDEVHQEIVRRLNPRLGRLLAWTPLQSWPLTLAIAKRFVADRIALVGDAAHVVHPLAGLGFNLGLKDTAALAEVVTLAAREGTDIGSPAVLARYEQWRRADTWSVAMMTEFLNRLFSNDNAAVRAVRDAGLGMVDRLPPLKTAFMREAKGLGGTDVPCLLQGQAI
ncbi:MAG: FAD-dependent monooxygenase [Hyphomicrobiales bacterium]